jgi:hypothetical protein
MPKPRMGRLIPILRKQTGQIDFRFIGGKLNTEKIGSSLVWVSCMPKAEKPKPPKEMTRTLGSIGGVVTFQLPQMIEFPTPCDDDFGKQINSREQIRQ